MDGQTRAGEAIRFGVFELDPASGELRKHGRRVRLQEQPFQVLLALLERPGEVVSREDLQQRLWPDGIFVDYEDGLATAVRKVRAALSDSATNPRFVETLPKRGYRFLAPVEGLAPSADASAASAQTASESGSQRARYRLAAGVAVSLVVVAALWSLRSGPPPEAPLVPIPLTSYPGAETQPSFSPDGSQVAFSWVGEDGDNQDIYLTTVEGGGLSRLTDDPAPDLAPAWSPDGSRIAFVRRVRKEDHTEEIYLVSPLGGQPQRLAKLRIGLGDWLPMNLSWSFDGEMLATAYEPEPGKRAIAVLSTLSGKVRQITFPPGRSYDIYSAVSPDGSTIAFLRRKYWQLAGGDIFVTTWQGSGTRQITDVDWFINALAWSPDGKDLVFASQELAGGVWRVSTDGGEPRPMLGQGQNVWSLAVSPSRNRLIYEARGTDASGDIWRKSLSANGGESRRFIAPTRTDAHAQLAFDGSRIAYRSIRSGSPEISVAKADGSLISDLTSMRARTGGTPRWSPDNQRLAFNMNVSGNLDVYVMLADGGVPTRLTDSDGSDSRPAWSHDGRWIYFQSNRKGTPDVWRVQADGGEADQITTDGGMNPKPAPDGQALYFTKPATGSVWRMDLASGAARPLLDVGGPGVSGCVEPLEDGLYYLTEEGEDRVLHRRDYDSGQTTEVAVLERSYGPVNCFSLYPDRSWLLYQRRDPPEADLMLVENFN